MKQTRNPAGLMVLAGFLFLLLPSIVFGAMVTSPKRGGASSQAVRQALSAPTKEGQVEALIQIITGEDLPAAMEAGDALATLGAAAVPRLVSQMRRTKNNWLIGGILSKMGRAAVDPLLEVLADADEASAVDCIYLLGELQDQRAVVHLIRQLADKRERIRLFAVAALLSIGGERAIEAVLEQLVNEERGLAGFVTEALLRHGKKGVEPLLRNAGHADPRVRREVAYLLGKLEDPRAADRLVQLVRDPEPLVRRNAAFALGHLSSTLQEFEDALKGLAGLLADVDEGVGDAAREALVRFGERSVPTLLEVCRSGGERELLGGLNALREIGNTDAEALMVDLLQHPSRAVKIASVAGLMMVGTERALEPLLNALRDEDLRWFASLALERLGSNRPELFVAAQPNDPHLTLRTEILVKLGPPVVPFLLRYLRDEEIGKRALALWVLGEIADASAVTGIVALLDDPVLGETAGRTLRKFGDVGFESLSRYATQPRSETGALQAVDALALFDNARAVKELEQCLFRSLPRKARVRAAVKLTLIGDPEASARLRGYLETEGQGLWIDVQRALRVEGQLR